MLEVACRQETDKNVKFALIICMEFLCVPCFKVDLIM